MKKLLGLSLAMVLALPLMALAQSSSSQSQDPAAQPSSSSQGTMGQNDSSMGKGSHAAKSGAVKGTISQDGKSLVSDTDGKSWTIANPDAVKGHEGHHVELKGSTDASTGEIQVTSVKMLKGEKGAMKKDDTMQK
jgi:hypothetical protein